jgi:hypothetical protein
LSLIHSTSRTDTVELDEPVIALRSDTPTGTSMNAAANTAIRRSLMTVDGRRPDRRRGGGAYGGRSRTSGELSRTRAGAREGAVTAASFLDDSNADINET